LLSSYYGSQSNDPDEILVPAKCRKQIKALVSIGKDDDPKEVVQKEYARVEALPFRILRTAGMTLSARTR
jgi:hypothetical protein